MVRCAAGGWHDAITQLLVLNTLYVRTSCCFLFFVTSLFSACLSFFRVALATTLFEDTYILCMNEF